MKSLLQHQSLELILGARLYFSGFYLHTFSIMFDAILVQMVKKVRGVWVCCGYRPAAILFKVWLSGPCQTFYTQTTCIQQKQPLLQLQALCLVPADSFPVLEFHRSVSRSLFSICLCCLHASCIRAIFKASIKYCHKECDLRCNEIKNKA